MVLGPDQAIVRLRYIPGLFNTYLRFVSGGVGSWRFAGAFAPDVKYFEPRHGLIRFGDKPFLLVTGQGYSGSGLSTELQSWLDLSRSGMEPVFQFTSAGHLSLNGVGVSRDVTGTLISLETGPERITIVRAVRFTAYEEDGEISLGSVRGTSVYTRRPDGNFQFESAGSSMTKKEVDELYEDFDSGLSNEAFLRYDFDNLKKLAAGKEGPERRWLRKFLAKCGDVPEKPTIVSLLSKAAH
jgi:hypothetical protein